MKLKSKGLIGLTVIAIAVFLLVVTIVPFNLDAAEGGTTSKCTNGTETCEGECCKATALGCEAGPCSVIFPQR